MLGGMTKKLFGSKNPSSIDLELSKIRGKVINLDKERLYDDVMKSRITSNVLKDENVKMKTRIHFLEAELQRKENLIDDLLM